MIFLSIPFPFANVLYHISFYSFLVHSTSTHRIIKCHGMALNKERGSIFDLHLPFINKDLVSFESLHSHSCVKACIPMYFKVLSWRMVRAMFTFIFSNDRFEIWKAIWKALLKVLCKVGILSGQKIFTG